MVVGDGLFIRLDRCSNSMAHMFSCSKGTRRRHIANTTTACLPTSPSLFPALVIHYRISQLHRFMTTRIQPLSRSRIHRTPTPSSIPSSVAVSGLRSPRSSPMLAPFFSSSCGALTSSQTCYNRLANPSCVQHHQEEGASGASTLRPTRSCSLYRLGPLLAMPDISVAALRMPHFRVNIPRRRRPVRLHRADNDHPRAAVAGGDRANHASHRCCHPRRHEG